MSAAWSKAVIGASRWLDANTPGGVISSRHIASPTKDWRLGMRVSLYLLVCDGRTSVRRFEKRRNECTIGTGVTPNKYKWIDAGTLFCMAARLQCAFKKSSEL